MDHGSSDDEQGTVVPEPQQHSNRRLDLQNPMSSYRGPGNEQLSRCESSSIQLFPTSSNGNGSFMSFMFKWWLVVIVSYVVPAIDICGIIYSAINPVTRRRENSQREGLGNCDNSQQHQDGTQQSNNLLPLISEIENENMNGTNNHSFRSRHSSSYRSSSRSLMQSNRSLLSSGKSLNSSTRSSENSSFRTARDHSENASFRTARDHSDEDAQTATTIASLATNKCDLVANGSLPRGNMEEYRKRLSEIYMRSEGRNANGTSSLPSLGLEKDDGKDEKTSKIMIDDKKQASSGDENDERKPSARKLDQKQGSVSSSFKEQSSDGFLEREHSKRKFEYKKQQSEKSQMRLESIDLEDMSESHLSRLSNDSQSGVRLRGDAYTFLMIKKPLHRAWMVGMATFIIQMLLLCLLLYSRLAPSSENNMFQIPFNVTVPVRGTQFFMMFVTILVSAHDLFKPIKELKMLWLPNKSEWSRVVSKLDQESDKLTDEDEEEPLVVLLTENDSNNNSDDDQDHSEPDQPTVHDENDKSIWTVHIVIPNLLRFMLGIFVTLMTFLIIIQAKTIPDLILNVLIIKVIARLNHIVFHLTKYGYLGSKLKGYAVLARKMRVADVTSTKCFSVPLRLVIFLTLFTTTICVFGPIISGQLNGSFLRTKYPNCQVSEPDKISKIADGICHGGIQNTFQCGFDGGDCIQFNSQFPDCKVINAFQIGNGHCEVENNLEECGFDGHDCCPIVDEDKYLGDGNCNAGFYFTNACKYDNGDCNELRKKFPFCPELVATTRNAYNGGPAVLGDGICDFIPQYMNEECGFEYGDCTECKVTDPRDLARLGDGICDGGKLNTAECGWDGGDCIECNIRVDDYRKIGDGICDGGKYLTKACNLDGLDCESCKVEDTKLIGNGVCDHGDYNTFECGWDGEDCQCINNAINGTCETNPSQMMTMHCRETCAIKPLLTETTVQLESANEASLCLTQQSESDGGLGLGECNASDFNQIFYLDKANAYSGLIRSAAAHDIESSNCLEMLANVLHFEDKIFMHPSCTDTWEVLETGAIKNMKHEKCLGRLDDSTLIIPVDCNSDLVEIWVANDSRHNLFQVSFETSAEIVGSSIIPSSTGPFEIEGYGVVPSECHESSGASCDIEIYGYTLNALILVTKTSDVWEYTVRGDVGEMIDWETELGGLHISPFPTLLGLGSFDRRQTYALEVKSPCFVVRLTTIVPSEANEDYSFRIDGYGQVPISCHSSKGAECDIQICGRRTLVLTAYTMETWKFSLSGDIGKLREYKTVPGGVHETIPTMDVVRHDFRHVYDLKTARKKATSKDAKSLNAKNETSTSLTDDFVKGNEKSIVLAPLQFTRNKFTQFVSQTNSSLCLTISENSFKNDFSYNGCRSTNGFFFIERFPDSSIFKLRSTSDNECIETKVKDGDFSSSLFYNVALNKPTTQSSTFDQGLSSKAVDGDINSSFFDSSVTHTEVSANPFWSVNLQGKYLISHIKVFNRDDPCCKSRLHDFKLSIFQDRKEVWSYQHTGEPKYITRIIPTPEGVLGNIVKIMLFGEERVLSLAQVEVYSRYSTVQADSSTHISLQNCTDSWQLLEDGALKNVNSSKCLGRQSGSSRPIYVECDSQQVQQWTTLGHQYMTYKIRFKTSSKQDAVLAQEPHSSGSFEIEGYGVLPSNCHNEPNAECEIEIYGINVLTIKAQTSDSWEFSVSGDIGPLLNFDTAPGGMHKSPFPTIMAQDGYDTRQTYALFKNDN